MSLGPLWSRARAALRRTFSNALRRDIALVTLTLAATATATVAGAAHLPLLASTPLAVALAALSVTIERAISATTAAPRIRYLAGALTLTSLLLVSAWAYHEWFDSTKPSTYAFYLDAPSEANYQRPSGKPGGPDLTLSHADLFGGYSYNFECTATDPKGGTWLKLAGQNFWYPRSAFTPVPGAGSSSDIPTCK